MDISSFYNHKFKNYEDITIIDLKKFTFLSFLCNFSVAFNLYFQALYKKNRKMTFVKYQLDAIFYRRQTAKCIYRSNSFGGILGYRHKKKYKKQQMIVKSIHFSSRSESKITELQQNPFKQFTK